jgi:hypothetical protein
MLGNILKKAGGKTERSNKWASKWVNGKDRQLVTAYGGR